MSSTTRRKNPPRTPSARPTKARRPKARASAKPPQKPKKSLPPQRPAAAPLPPVEPPAFDPALSALAAALSALLTRFQEQDGASPHGAMTRALWALHMMLGAIRRYLDNPAALRLVSRGAGLMTAPATTTTATAPATTAPPPGQPPPALPSPSTALGAAHHRLAAIAREAFEDLAEEVEASLGSADAAFHDPGATREAALGELSEGLRGLRRLWRTLGNLGHTLTGEPWQASPAAHLAALRELLAAAHLSMARGQGSARLAAARAAFSEAPAPTRGEASPAPSESGGGQAGQTLHPTHYGLVLVMGEAFRFASLASETATSLALDLHAHDPKGASLRLPQGKVTELQGHLFALVGQLGEASARLTGEGAEACAAEHVEALATLAALVAPDADAPWIRGPRIDGARAAFEGRAA